jgi:hypothetical protein
MGADYIGWRRCRLQAELGVDGFLGRTVAATARSPSSSSRTVDKVSHGAVEGCWEALRAQRKPICTTG